MEYIKGGQIFNPAGNYEWMDSYASPVTSVELEDRIRVYFSTRSKIDEKGFFTSYTGFIDVDKNEPSKVLYIHDKPLLEVGRPGTFDEHGIMVAEVVKHGDKFYMYYMGWQRSDTVPYVIRTGLALSDDGCSFTKVSEGPVIGLNRFIPFGVGNLSIVIEQGRFHMWYTHYKPWLNTPIGFRPTYDIRYAWSDNGLDWIFGDECVRPENDNESIATPCVRYINGSYHMWYAYRPAVDERGRSGPYSIGYASSPDGQQWTRQDRLVGLTVSETGWDSEMVCAPDMLKAGDDLLLFYCGNHYGRDGFGYARIKNL